MTDNEFARERVENLESLEDNGYESYPSELSEVSGDVTEDTVREFINEYENEDEVNEDSVWRLVGRLTRENEFGDFAFFDIDDRTADVQIMCRRDGMSNYDDIYNLNIGDIVAVTGTPGYSNTGELTLYVDEFEVAAKCLTEFSREWNQLGTQQQIQNRTGALATNDELYNTIQSRFEIEGSIREFLTNSGFMEVSTPVLHNYSGGAEATPFETYCQALDEDVYLRIAPELYLKRLITAGYSQVFELSSTFRNEDIDTTHNPEFTMLELYQSFADYEDMMELTESLFNYCAVEVTGDPVIEYNGVEYDLSESWTRLTFDDAIEQYTGHNTQTTEREVWENILDEQNIDYEGLEYDQLLMEVFEEEVEPNLDGPVFIINYPTVSTPLCDRVDGSDNRVERFEGFIGGMEVANAYSELTDPREQRERLVEQVEDSDDDINYEFVEALSYGMPPTGGLGIGVERLAMVLLNCDSIKDVIPYPMTSSRV